MVLAIYPKVEDIKGQVLILVEDTLDITVYQSKSHHLNTLLKFSNMFYYIAKSLSASLQCSGSPRVSSLLFL